MKKASNAFDITLRRTRLCRKQLSNRRLAVHLQVKIIQSQVTIRVRDTSEGDRVARARRSQVVVPGRVRP